MIAQQSSDQALPGLTHVSLSGTGAKDPKRAGLIREDIALNLLSTDLDRRRRCIDFEIIGTMAMHAVKLSGRSSEEAIAAGYLTTLQFIQ